MASEVLKRDENNIPVIGLVTDNAAQEVKMGRIDDNSKGLKVIIVGGLGAGTVTSVAVTGANGIGVSGSPITSTGTIALSLGNITPTSISTSSVTLSEFTQGSVIFAGSAGLLSQDNINLFYDSVNKQLQIGPSAGFDGNSQIQLSLSNNINNFSGVYSQNKSAGNTASTDFIVGADNDGVSLTGHFGDFGVQSSGNTGGTLFTGLLANDVYCYASGGNLVLGTDAGVAGKIIKFFAGGLTTTNQVAQIATTGLTVGLTGTTLGKVVFAGSTSTSITLQGQAVGSSSVLTLPTGTDTLVGLTLTQALINKTYNGNTFTAGTGILTIATAKTLTVSNTLTLAGMDGKGINVDAATSGKILVGDGSNMVLSTPTFPNAAGTSGNVITSDGTNFVSSAPAGSSEWTYLSKVTYAAASGAQSFTSLSVHDSWKLVYRLYNTTTTDLSQQLTLNNVTASNYNTFYISTGSGGWVAFSGQAYFRPYGQGITLALNLEIEIVISGKHRQGVKSIAVSYISDGNTARSDTQYGQTGALTSDSNDLTRIDINTTGVCTGTVELWYKDAK